MLVVHPEYWNNRHGRYLVQWGMEYAAANSLRLVTVVSNRGTKLCTCLSWTAKEKISLAGDSVVSDGVSVTVMEYDPSSASAKVLPTGNGQSGL